MTKKETGLPVDEVRIFVDELSGKSPFNIYV